MPPQDEIDEALHHSDAPRMIGGFPIHQAEDFLGKLQTYVVDKTEIEQGVDEDLYGVRQRIDARCAQLERVCAGVEELKDRAASRRREAIYRKISQNLKDTAREAAGLQVRIDEKRLCFRELLNREKSLVDALKDEARLVGLGDHTPNELEWAVEQMLAGDSLEYVEESLNCCF